MWHTGNPIDDIGALMLPQPGVDVLCGGGAPLLGGPHPTLTWHDGGDGLIIGEQDAGPIGKGHLSLVAADLLDFHGGVVWYGIILQGQRRN